MDDLKQSDNENIALAVIASIDVSFRDNKCKSTVEKFCRRLARNSQRSTITKPVYDVIKFNG